MQIWRNAGGAAGLTRASLAAIVKHLPRQPGIVLGHIFLKLLIKNLHGHRVAHQRILALRSLGVPAELTGRNDIFVEGRKVSGYARRVSHNQEIIHGTLMYDVDLDTLIKVLDTPTSKMQAKGISSVKSRVANLKEYLPQFSSLDELQAKLQEILSAGDGQMPLSAEQIAEVRKQADEKFSTWDFIYGHSHEADFRCKAKLACGTVEADIRVDRGLIARLDFSGDFLFDTPAQELAAKMIGLRYDPADIKAFLASQPVASYFRGATPDDLAALLFKPSSE